jgi:hypothetical protein
MTSEPFNPNDADQLVDMVLEHGTRRPRTTVARHKGE